MKVRTVRQVKQQRPRNRNRVIVTGIKHNKTVEHYFLFEIT